MEPELQSLALSLTEAALRNTAASVADRIGVATARKKNDETIRVLEEIVNELIDDKSELVRIANAYEEELVAQRISPENIEYITTHILPVIERLMTTAGGGGTSPAAAQQFMNLVKPLLSVETVTVLQLVGFNFQKGIGGPLTELVRQLILARAPRQE